MTINVSFKLLNAFLALSEHKNFTRAAEYTHVSQSAFSGMIQRLEEEVGTRLFDRDTRNVALTPEGELFATATRQLVKDIEWTFSDLRDYVTKKKGRVSVAALPSISGGWLSPVIAAYRDRYPEISIEVHDVLSSNCLELLQQGLTDIVLAAPNFSLDAYCFEHFYTDHYFLICRQDNPIAQLKSVTVADLKGCDFVHLAHVTSVYQHSIDMLDSSGANSSSIVVQQLPTLAGLILNGLGVSLLPELTLYQFRHPDLVSIPLTSPRLSRSINIIWRKERPLSIAAQAMLDLFREKKPSIIKDFIESNRK